MAEQKKQNVLPPTLNSIFKTIHKLYEQNQFKRALKAADKVLQGAPNHGETLSMKGLVLNQLNRKHEAFAFARRGLKFDLKSHLCWHILGILYRSERHYLEAAKCFENALFYQKENLQILRDLTTMHIQNRNYEGFQKLSNILLIEKPGTRSHWSAFAVSAHLAGDYDVAVRVIESYDGTIDKTAKEKYERSEILFYKVQVIEESGDIKRALEELEKNKDAIVDKEEWKSKRAEYLIKLLRFDDAEEQYKILIKGNPDNWAYYLGLFKALKLAPLDLNSLLQSITLEEAIAEKLSILCDTLAKEHSFSKVPRQIPLSFLSGGSFKEKFQKFIFPNLTKGVPSLFVLVKYLYNDKSKAKIIEEVFLEIEKNLESLNKLSPSEEQEEPPSTILWTWHYLAEHYNCLYQAQRALYYVDKCQKHTPTVLDFELLKAKIYKTAGDSITAAKHTEEARQMDLADRYLNTKATRFFLRADKVKNAEQTISIFTKVEPENNSYRNNIYDMQVVWYEFEEGMSWLRQEKYGLALKKFTDIEKQFMDIHSDQLEFHSFCHRKMTLRQYLRMLRLEDRLLGHDFYVKAANQIVKIYLHLYTNPIHKTVDDKADENLSEADRKKAERKRKRQVAQEKREKEKKEQELQEKLKAKPNKFIDLDPNGDKLVFNTDPLVEAHKYMNQLIKFADNKLTTHLLGYQVSLHRKKYLLALRSVLKGISFDPTNPEVHTAVIKLFHAVSHVTLHPHVKTVFDIEAKSILGGKTLAQYNDAFLAAHGHKVSVRRAHFECALLIGSHQKEKLLSNLENTEDPEFPLEECIKVHKILQKEFGEKKAEDYKKHCQHVFPFARYYSDKPEEEPPTVNKESEPEEDGESKDNDKNKK